MKVRQHRGSLDDSMQTQIEIEPSMSAVMDYLKKQWSGYLSADAVSLDNIAIDYYGHDNRIEQDVYFVTVGRITPAALLDGVPTDYVPTGVLRNVQL